jgi:SAM-dependent methyltransferase
VSDEDRERWDRRFAAIGAAEVAAPPAELRGAEELLPTGGRALDVACGRGATAVWLAQRGFAVDAVDVSPVALRGGAELADRCGVADRIRWHAHDLDAGLPPAIGVGFAVVVCQRFRDPRLNPALAGALAPGGLLVLTVLSRSGGEDGPYRAEPGELPAAFGGLEVLAHRDADGAAALVARAPLRTR